jgi:hypothetical protein
MLIKCYNFGKKKDVQKIIRRTDGTILNWNLNIFNGQEIIKDADISDYFS